MASKEEKLTEKQEMFCRHFVEVLNATEAYARAYYPEAPEKANRTTCGVEGHKALKKPKIRSRIKELQQEIKDNLMISQEWVLQKAMETFEAAMKGRPVFAYNKETHKMEKTGEREPNTRDANDSLKIINSMLGYEADKRISVDSRVQQVGTIISEDLSDD